MSKVIQFVSEESKWPPTSAHVHENSFERSYTIGQEGWPGHKLSNWQERTV